jgi:glucose-1-phosphate cytidylyltransferase
VKTVILAGGRGTRLGEETRLRPKPMVEVGGIPILIHLMGCYARHGYKDFMVALGHLGEVIEEYFSTADSQGWSVSLAKTGESSMTGGRLHRLQSELSTGGPFMFTYGDGVADVDISALVAFHKRHGKIATVTAVHPPARFGELSITGDQVVDFHEKPQVGAGWINGGFFVLEPGVFDYLHGDMTVFEQDPLENLAKDGQLMAFKHEGFWHPMDTVRDRDVLEELWTNGVAPWRAE